MADPPTLFVLNGPNLNMLGRRQTAIYGSATLAEIDALCRERAATHRLAVSCRQSNHEGELIGWIHEARDAAFGIVINAGAFTHTSIAIHDALLAAEKPVVEVHLSNIFRREEFRQVSFIAKVAIGSICGFGPLGYAMAIDALARHLRTAQ